MKKRQRVEDSLAKAFPEATAQQQFMLCLQDRIESLEQRLNDLDSGSIIPKNLTLSGCFVASMFVIQCHILQNDKPDVGSFVGELLSDLAYETTKVVACHHDSGKGTSIIELVLDIPRSMTSLSIGQTLCDVAGLALHKLEVHGLNNVHHKQFLSEEISRCQHADKETPCFYIWQNNQLHFDHVPPPAMISDLIDLSFELLHPASIFAKVADVMHAANATS